MWMQVKAKTLSVLKDLSNPKPTRGGTSEAVAWTFYDTASYVSGTTTELAFFSEGRANVQATNLRTQGALPEPQYFEIGHFGLNILREPSANAWTDVWRLLTGGTAGPPSWTFTLADKKYGPFPVLELHSAGGITGFGTATSQNYANSAETGSVGPNGAFQGGAIVIPPQQNFDITLNWDGAQTLLDGDCLIQPYMAGVLHRRVL